MLAVPDSTTVPYVYCFDAVCDGIIFLAQIV